MISEQNECIIYEVRSSTCVQSAPSHLLVLLAVPSGLIRVEAPLGVSQQRPLRGGAHVIKGCKGCMSTH